MRKGAEDSARAVSRLLHVVALGALVDLRVELLLGACVAVRTLVAVVAVARLAPLLAVLHVGAGGAAVLVLARRATLVLAVVVLWAGVTLAAEPRRALARLRLVRRQHIVCIWNEQREQFNVITLHHIGITWDRLLFVCNP